MSMQAHAIVFETNLGWTGLCWTLEDKLLASCFGRSTPRAAWRDLVEPIADWDVNEVEREPGWISELADDIRAYANGEFAGDFRHVPVELSDRTEFQRKVLNACQAIAPGETASYSDLAAKAGSPRAARAVGTVMSGNRAPLIVPCHRVVGSDGKLCGFSAPDGINMKQRLLDLEAETIGVA